MDFYNQRWVRFIFRHDGVTIGPFVFYAVPKSSVSRAFACHENCHKIQWRRYWYIGFPFVYLYENIRHGYRNNKFEVEARLWAAQDRWE